MKPINPLDDGFGRPKTMNYLRRRCTWNIRISPLAKITKLMPASCFHLSQHGENETKSRKR